MLESKYAFTQHSRGKMLYYGIAEGRVKRIIRAPKRTEEGVVPNTIAAMQPAGSKRYQEIWVMYKLIGSGSKEKQIKVITAWRYPGKSPERDPIPVEIIQEIKSLL